MNLRLSPALHDEKGAYAVAFNWLPALGFSTYNASVSWHLSLPGLLCFFRAIEGHGRRASEPDVPGFESQLCHFLGS